MIKLYKSLLVLSLLLILLISGCASIELGTFSSTGSGSGTGSGSITGGSAIGSEGDAADALMNVSSGVEDIESTLDDIDDLLS